jgi:hypothetical protein
MMPATGPPGSGGGTAATISSALRTVAMDEYEQRRHRRAGGLLFHEFGTLVPQVSVGMLPCAHGSGASALARFFARPAEIVVEALGGVVLAGLREELYVAVDHLQVGVAHEFHELLDCVAGRHQQ